MIVPSAGFSLRDVVLDLDTSLVDCMVRTVEMDKLQADPCIVHVRS